jgi:uroporphyrinogen decarboxylase
VSTKELVLQAITFRSPYRPPLYFRTDPERSDIVQVPYYAPTNFVDADKTRDELGCIWNNVIGTGTGYVIKHPLDNWAALERYALPDPRLPSRYVEIERAVQKYPDKFVVAAIGLSGFSLMTALRGFENVLSDLYLNPEPLTRLADLVFGYEAVVIEEIGRRGANGVWFFDDWGTERNLFIKPEQWRQFFKPRYAAQFRRVHELGMRAFFHSCGCVWKIIPEMIDIGVDVLNLEQMLLFGSGDQTGYERLRQAFGGKVCFTVNVDSQRTLINGSPEEIEQEIRHIFRTFDLPQGGFIAFADAGKDHNIVPPENLRLVENLFQRELRRSAEPGGDTAPARGAIG